jgi:hypothetical protein
VLAEKADILVRRVGVNPTRTGVLDILRQMGASISLEQPRTMGEEPVADIRVRSSKLRGIDVDPALVSLAIDEFPVLFVAAAAAAGRTRFSGIAELRVKESDRIAAMAAGLLVKGGGHAMAAGLTVTREQFEALKAFVTERLKTTATSARHSAALEVDGALMPAAANDALIGLLERAGPYGQGNPQPRFVFPSHRVRFAKVVGDAHVRCVLEAADGSRIDAIAFRSAGQPLGDLLVNAGGLPLHVCGQLRKDTWGGKNRIEVQIDDVADPRRQG